MKSKKSQGHKTKNKTTKTKMDDLSFLGHDPIPAVVGSRQGVYVASVSGRLG
jgi:hypothetical protein